MNPTPILYSEFTIPLLIAMFFAVTMGGSGTAPAFAAAYGANLIRARWVPWLFGTLVFVGALVAGKKVVLTISGGILPADLMGITITSIILLAVALSMLAANLLRVPQSTSQSTVLALVGVALYFDKLNTEKLLWEIIPAWFILPIIGFFIVFIVASIYKPVKAANQTKFTELAAHPTLKYIVIAASCYVAFSIGSNNVANASGPIISLMLNKLELTADSRNLTLVMLVATLMVAPCFGIGSAMFGQKLMDSTGKQIIEIGPLAASVIAFVTATLLLLASLTKGIPTSLVQLNTATILGLGVVKAGWKTVFQGEMIQRFWIIWIVAPLLAMGIAWGLTYLADVLGLLKI